MSRRSGQDGLARPVCQLCPEGRAKIARSDPFAYWVQKVGSRWFGPTRLPIVSRRLGQDISARAVCLLGPEGRAKMVWPIRLPIGSRRSGQIGLADPFAYWVQTPERRADISRPDPTRLSPTGRSARQQVCTGCDLGKQITRISMIFPHS